MCSTTRTNHPEKGEPAVRFGVVADVQYAQKPAADGRYYADAAAALESCITDFTTEKIDFAIQLGDLINGGSTAAQDLRTAVGIFGRLTLPKYHVVGNHDFAGLKRAAVLDILGMRDSYYSFDIRNRRFVVLDTQDLAVQGGWDETSRRYRASATMLAALQQTGAANAVDYNGGIGTDQKLWLQKTLRAAEADGKSVVVFGHTPLLPDGEKHTLWNAGEIVALLEMYGCVKAYFCGHKHDGGYLLHNGIHYITLEAMVDAANRGGGWALVTLTDDAIRIDGVGAVTGRDLTAH